jgi:ribosomal protein S18 acetylase RimI-like enzyme
MRGYIAMLATREEHRGKGIAGRLVRIAVQKMKEKDADEVRIDCSVGVRIKVSHAADRSRNRSR